MLHNNFLHFSYYMKKRIFLYSAELTALTEQHQHHCASIPAWLCNQLKVYLRALLSSLGPFWKSRQSGLLVMMKGLRAPWCLHRWVVGLQEGWPQTGHHLLLCSWPKFISVGTDPNVDINTAAVCFALRTLLVHRNWQGDLVPSCFFLVFDNRCITVCLQAICADWCMRHRLIGWPFGLWLWK